MRIPCSPVLALLLLSCSDAPDTGAAAPDTGAAATFCADLAGQNAGCWSQDLDASCLEVYRECGPDISTLESCPVQLSCE